MRCNECPGNQGANADDEAEDDCVFGMEVADCLVADCAAEDCRYCSGLMKSVSHVAMMRDWDTYQKVAGRANW
jgi:hypothetical protein